MSNGTIEIRVCDYKRRPLNGAHVSAGRHAGQTDANGRLRLDVSEADVLEVEMPGYQGQKRAIAGRDRERMQVFLLGCEGMPFYWRGLVKVPFQPLPGLIGIMTVAGKEGDAVRPVVEGLGGKVVRQGGNFARNGIIVIEVDDSKSAQALARLHELMKDGSILHAGAVLELSEHRASFLTESVLALFDEAVSEDEVAQIAALHGLTPEEHIAPLGNVHRFSYGRPATFALLEAVNALAEDERVVWAEPDLASTIELDGPSPTDFLFKDQWDFATINMLGAWDALTLIDPSHRYGDPDIVVAVMDNGIDDTHPELSGMVSNGNNKQVALFDFGFMTNDMSHINSNLDPADHGTSCASACVGNTNNASPVAGIGEGIAGIAGNCRLIGVRVTHCTDHIYAKLYLWVAGFDAHSAREDFPAKLSRGADIITTSLGCTSGTPIAGIMALTFDNLTEAGRNGLGVLLFFSVGNGDVDLDVTFDRPWSMYDRCFGVAASTIANDGVTETRATYSNFGSTVDWCIPSSSDLTGLHSPPASYGVLAATILDAPAGMPVCGHPERQSTLATPVLNTPVLPLLNAVGFVEKQAVLVNPPGGIASGGLITGVDIPGNQITLDVNKTLPVSTTVAAGPRAYRANFGGTSYATPVAAGVGALILSANPGLRWGQVSDIIRSTAAKIDPGNTDSTGRWRDEANRKSTDQGYDGAYFSEFYGYGRIDAAKAVEKASGQI
jgi:subtilisin family serine protease